MKLKYRYILSLVLMCLGISEEKIIVNKDFISYLFLIDRILYDYRLMIANIMYRRIIE